MFQYDEFDGDRYTNIRQIRIAKNRKEEWNKDTMDTVKAALREGIDASDRIVHIEHLLIRCYKERPTLGTWPERTLQFKNQSLLFYNNVIEAAGDSKPR